MIAIYSLGAIATLFSATQALTGNDLIPDVHHETGTGIIWNSDKSLCLKLSGKVFEDERSGEPAGKQYNPIKRKNTCAGVSASFSPDCVDLMEDGTAEDDLPLQYRFRISEHPDRGDRFCIINACDDGLNPSGSVYKLQWNEAGKKRGFGLKDFGGLSTNTLKYYFKWSELNALTYGHIDRDNSPVTWKNSDGNTLQLKTSDNLERYDFFGSHSCESQEIEHEYLDLNNNPTTYTVCGNPDSDGNFMTGLGYNSPAWGFNNYWGSHSTGYSWAQEKNLVIVDQFPATLETFGYPNILTETENTISCHTKIVADLPEGWVFRVKVTNFLGDDWYDKNSVTNGKGIDQCTFNLLSIGWEGRNWHVCEGHPDFDPNLFIDKYRYFKPEEQDGMEAYMDMISYTYGAVPYSWRAVVDIVPEDDPEESNHEDAITRSGDQIADMSGMASGSEVSDNADGGN